MNKTTFALALGTCLALSLNTSKAHGSSTIQALDTADMSASTFNSMFTPYNTAMISPFTFSGSTGTSGQIESQVFTGTGAAAGLYAYAYEVAVNNTSANGDPVHVDSSSFNFGATPVGANLTGGTTPQYGYVVQNGQVGGLTLSGNQTPTYLSWQAGATTGVIRAAYADTATQTNPVGAGATSATFVLLSTQAPTSSNFNSVNVGGAAATTTIPLVYTPSGGSIEPIPVPEPATILAWAGMAGAVAMVRRFRKTRQALAA